jgi:hypothetical protein
MNVACWAAWIVLGLGIGRFLVEVALLLHILMID